MLWLHVFAPRVFQLHPLLPPPVGLPRITLLSKRALKYFNGLLVRPFEPCRVPVPSMPLTSEIGCGVGRILAFGENARFFGIEQCRIAVL